MNIDADDISEKSFGLTFVLLLLFGSIGAHRFYVGKIKSGLLYFIVGVPGILVNLLKVFGIDIIKSAFISVIASLVIIPFLLFDIYAMYSEIFSDSKEKIILSVKHREEITGSTPDKKFEDKMNMFITIGIFIVLMIVRYIILPSI